jgi:hypothetical protein
MASKSDDEFYTYVLSPFRNKSFNDTKEISIYEVDKLKTFLCSLSSLNRKNIKLIPFKNKEIADEVCKSWYDSHHGINPIYFLMSVDVITRKDICHYLKHTEYTPDCRDNKVFNFMYWLANNISSTFIRETLGLCGLSYNSNTNIIEFYFSLTPQHQKLLLERFYKEK